MSQRIIKEYLPGIIKEKGISWYKNAHISVKIDENWLPQVYIYHKHEISFMNA